MVQLNSEKINVVIYFSKEKPIDSLKLVGPNGTIELTNDDLIKLVEERKKK